jgi:hypothetical protein
LTRLVAVGVTTTVIITFLYCKVLYSCMVQHVLYNSCFGGFSITDDVFEWVRDNEDMLRERYDSEAVDECVNVTLVGETYDDGSGPKTFGDVHPHEISRDNPLLVDIVLGASGYDGKIDGSVADISIATVPDGVEWEIDEYDGQETVREQTRSFS